MSTSLLRVAVGDGSGRIPVQRIRRFVRAAGRRWPAVAIQMRELSEGPDGRWVGVLLCVANDSEEAEQQRESLEARLVAYLDGNRAHYRSTYFPSDLSFDEALQFE